MTSKLVGKEGEILISMLLILAWKVAGWYGLDRWLLPRLGTPWTRAPAPAAEPNVQPVPTL